MTTGISLLNLSSVPKNLPLSLVVIASIQFSLALLTYAQSKVGNRTTETGIQESAAEKTKIVSPAEVKIRLETRNDKEGAGISAAGTQVKLTNSKGGRTGCIQVGNHKANVILKLGNKASDPSEIGVDVNLDGKINQNEIHSVTPTFARNRYYIEKFVVLKLKDQSGNVTPYGVMIWHAQAPDEEKPDLIRWSPRHWATGIFTLGSITGKLYIVEMNGDGKLTADDYWSINQDKTNSVSTQALGLTEGQNGHVWFEKTPFKLVSIDNTNGIARLKAVDLAMSFEEASSWLDPTYADRMYPRSTEKIKFFTDYNSALKQAKQSGKTVFVDFSTTWCGPCKQMDKLVFTAHPVVEMAKNLVMVKLDGDQEKELVKKFQVSGFPAFRLIKADGTLINRESGYMPVRETLDFMNDVTHEELVGTWVGRPYSQTPKVKISRDGEGLSMRIWGYQGGEMVELPEKVRLQPIGSHVEDKYCDYAFGSLAYSWADHHFILHMTKNKLVVEEITIFKDDSGRTNMRERSEFIRER